MEAKLTCAVPVMPTIDISESIAFYTEKLGFELAFAWDDEGQTKYAGVSKDAVRVHLSGYFEAELAKTVGSQLTLRFDCSDVRAFYEECKQHEGVIHPKGALEEKPWGSLEFAVIDPCGVCISFQQEESEEEEAQDET